MNSDDLFIDTNLPKPLSKKEIYSYFEKMKQGDMKAREEIINHNIKLVLYQVKNRFNDTPYEQKELVSIGLIGLIKSVDTFDTTKNYSFASYATRCIDNEILMFLRKGKKSLSDQSLDSPISTDSEGDERTLQDILEDDNADLITQYERKETQNIIREIINNLSNRDQKIIILYFGFHNNQIYSQKEIADQLGISRSYVSRLIQRIVKQIEKQLRNIGLIESIEKSNDSKIPSQSKKTDDQRNTIAQNEVRRNNTMARNLKSIYEIFNSYTKEQVDEIISKLTDEERDLITLRYGEDLENPVSSTAWGSKENSRFYGGLIPKMKRFLSNSGKTKKQVIQKNEDNNPQDITVSESKQQNSSQMTKEDCIKILEMLRVPSFGQMLGTLTPKEAIIISLRLGYVDGKYFSPESISEFLGIELEEVSEISKKILLLYKDNINHFIDKAIDITTGKVKLYEKDKN